MLVDSSSRARSPDTSMDFDRRQPAPPTLDAILHRGGQSELVETWRPQSLHDVANDNLQMIRHANDRKRDVADRGRATVAPVAKAHRVDLDRVDVLSQLVVQFARENPAFVLLGAHPGLREQSVLVKRLAQLRLDHVPVP